MAHMETITMCVCTPPVQVKAAVISYLLQMNANEHNIMKSYRLVHIQTSPHTILQSHQCDKSGEAQKRSGIACSYAVQDDLQIKLINLKQYESFGA